VGKLRLDIERKGRAGKVATIISGFTLPPEEVERIAATLKSKLGTGGSARGGEILIQGDRRTDVISLLSTLGLK
jgi:translation initiation factor 1